MGRRAGPPRGRRASDPFRAERRERGAPPAESPQGPRAPLSALADLCGRRIGDPGGRWRGARAIRTGSIEAGKAADLIVCAKDPLADLSALRTLSMVIKDGYRVEHPAPKKLPEVERELDKFL